jgi:hypothetical protein
MPVRFERRRAPLAEADLRHLGGTVVDLTDSVERLVPRRRSKKDPARRQAEPGTAAPPGKRALRPPRQRRRQRPRAGQPLEDSAFFDPARCDFASLVKKLDDVSGND